MSRVGKKPILIPEKVKVDFNDHQITVEGPLGKISKKIHPDIDLEINNNQILVKRRNEDKFYKALHGLFRTLIFNLIEGVTKGFQKVLIIEGVGFRASLESNQITLQLGFSHLIIFKLPEGIKAEIEKQTIVTLKGIDKELLGQTAAALRKLKKPEPYKGKGVRYQGEVIRKKVGKTAVTTTAAGGK